MDDLHCVYVCKLKIVCVFISLITKYLGQDPLTTAIFVYIPKVKVRLRRHTVWHN